MDKNAQAVYIPHYDLVNQSGLDIQATIDSLLLKLEIIHQRSNYFNYYASTSGLEYTFYGVFDSAADVGLLVEYMYDDRGQQATTIFEDDILLGMRLTLNDAQSSELLFGMIRDRDNDSLVLNLEASRRLSDHWKLSVEGRLYKNIPASDLLLASFARDDYVQFNLAYYY